MYLFYYISALGAHWGTLIDTETCTRPVPETLNTTQPEDEKLVTKLGPSPDVWMALP